MYSKYAVSENNCIFLQEMRKREYLHHKTTTVRLLEKDKEFLHIDNGKKNPIQKNEQKTQLFHQR